MPGGNLTPGVVRVGDTVRRPAAPFAARVLRHLAHRGFDGSPRFLGTDGRGRDVLSYLPGETRPKWQRYADHQVRAAAVLLHRLHDATRDLAVRLGGEVICHHDPGPHNAIFVGGVPVAFVDFDQAAPGDPVEDVAYLAWSWCVSSRGDRLPAEEQAQQVRVVADGYSLAEPERLLEALRRRLASNEEVWRARPDHRRCAEFRAWTARESAFVDLHRGIFAAALDR